jgi:hypothetical protein
MVEEAEEIGTREEDLKIKKRIDPGHGARAIRNVRFVFIYPSQPHRAALKEQVF